MSAPWVLVAGGFHESGGMDRANAALASYLIERDVPVHLVAHTVDDALSAAPGVSVRRVPRPAGSFFLGEWALERTGVAVARSVLAAHPDARVLVNGGNCCWPGINWVHYVHHADQASGGAAPAWVRPVTRIKRAANRARERRALRSARVVIANSESTRLDLLRYFELPADRVHTVYLGASGALRPPTDVERAVARGWLQVPDDRPVVVFVGALGHDHRKGFDVLFEVWKRVCAGPDWDALLVVAGAGRALDAWRAAALAAGLADRVRFLGFTPRVGEVLGAADLLVSPTRYEPYGLNVQEAICRGVPAIVSRVAGVAEHYPRALDAFLLDDPDDADALERALLDWRPRMREWRDRFAPLSATLRAHGWDDMARRMVEIADEAYASRPTAALRARVAATA